MRGLPLLVATIGITVLVPIIAVSHMGSFGSLWLDMSFALLLSCMSGIITIAFALVWPKHEESH